MATRWGSGRVDRAGLLCPYPQIGRYKGIGGIDDAMNFRCEMPEQVRFPAA